MPTSDPPPLSIIWRAAPCSVRNAPSRLTEVTRRNSSSVMSTNGVAPEPPPALAKHGSTRPSSATVEANAASTAAGSETSHSTARTRVPCWASRSRAAALRSVSRPQIARSAPACARPSAMPRPIPPLPPVTTATWPLRSNMARHDARLMILVLGAGYIGAKVAQLALARGEEVVLADNWHATRREQVEGLGAHVEDVDVRRADDVARVLAMQPSRVIFLAAQASRPLSWSDPDYTEQTNLVGARVVAQAVREAGRPPVAFGSTLHVYGGGLSGAVGADHPYGAQGDLSHLSKIYAELCLRMYGLDVRLLRLGIVYGPSPVEHDAPEFQTVIDKFRRRHAEGQELTLDDGGRATIGAVHVEDAARILLDADDPAANVAAETVTVGQVAAMVRGEAPARAPEPEWRFVSPYDYEHRLL